MMFLPTTKAELQAQSIDQPDFIVVSADAYVDHPSFGHALIARLVQSQGFSAAVLPQPVSDKEFLSLGAPKHAFLLSAGVVDSMVNNYHVSKTKRTEDVYSDEGKFGRRPDRVTEVYAKALKRLFPDSPIIAGGIEPSLRRLAHYDYWDDKVRHSILFSAPCDLIIYGMGEQPILEILSYAKKNVPLHKLKEIKGTAYLTDLNSANKQIKKAILENDRTYYNLLSSFSRVSTDKSLYGKSFLQAQQIFDSPTPKGLIQKQDNDHFVVINPPSLPLPQKVFDSVYALPFMKKAHPRYKHIPALEEVQFSVTAHRGCFGNCSFCALTYHQGQHVLARSTESVLTEVENLTHLEGFKGYIHDIGGPTANFHAPSCHKNETDGNCKNKECIGHKPCGNLRVNHKEYTEILRRAKNIKGVKKVFVRSGVRFDYAMMDSDKSFLKELTAHHVSGQLKVAPEHCSNKVLKLMNKPPFEVYKNFTEEFMRLSKQANKEQYLVPYFVSSHPGCTLQDAAMLTEYLMNLRTMPLQVQDFYPTPATLSTVMYYTEQNPKTGEKLFVAKNKEDKAMQRALLQYRLPQNKALVKKALLLAGREDLIKRL